MRTIIFVAERPEENASRDGKAQFHTLLAQLEKIVRCYPTIQALASNVLVFGLEKNMNALVECGTACYMQKSIYKVLFLPETPAWVTSCKQDG